MIKREFSFVLFYLVFLIFFTSLVSANFACGQVNPKGNFSFAWFDVNIHYEENFLKTTSCSISPDDNKFCCDPSFIKGVGWSIGKRLYAEMYDNLTGYYASPVSLVISGEGFDVFPELTLKKIIKINEPSERIYINQTTVELNVKVERPFSNVSYKIYKEDEIYLEGKCNDCNNISNQLKNLSFGSYSIKIYARDSTGRAVSQDMNFTLLKYLEIYRKFECKKCKGGFVFSGGNEVNVSIVVNSSHPIKGVLSDIFPNDWEMISRGSGDIKSYSDTHDVISWNFEGKEGEKKYLLSPPKIFLWEKYYFQSKFDETPDKQDEIILYRLFRMNLFAKNKSYNFSSNEIPYRFSYMSPSTPLVAYPKNDHITQVVIVPNNKIGQGQLIIRTINKKAFDNSIYEFSLHHNLMKKDVDKIYLKFKINKNLTFGNDSIIRLYRYENKKHFEKLNLNKTSETEDEVYYETFLDENGKYAFVNGDIK